MPKVKVLVVTHKKSNFPKGNCFVSIHAGRAVAKEVSKDGKIKNKDLKWLIDNTIGDDTGDNISKKNRYYNEITAIYWAWKNYDKIGNPDYIGLMHYRRHFVFNEDYFNKQLKKMNRFNRGFSVIKEDFVNDKYLKRIDLNDKNIDDCCVENDVIVIHPAKISYAYNNYETLKSDYVNYVPDMRAEDFDLMIEVIKEKYPEISSEIDEYVNGDTKSPYQMFIMKKELFFEYCEFLFNILFELEKRIDFTNYSVLGKRTLGYLGENLLSAFFILKRNSNIKYKYLGTTFIKCATKKELTKYRIKQFLRTIFSIKNDVDERHKDITIFGLKIKVKRKTKTNAK